MSIENRSIALVHQQSDSAAPMAPEPNCEPATVPVLPGSGVDLPVHPKWRQCSGFVGLVATTLFALNLVVLACLHTDGSRGALWQTLDDVLLAGMGVLVGGLVVALSHQQRRLRTRTAALEEEIVLQERAHDLSVARANDLEQQVAARTATLQEQAERMLKLYHMAYDFVGNVSHEFRTPLTVIKEYVSALEDALADTDLDAETRAFFTTIHARVDDLCLMVDDLIDVTRLEADIVRVSRRPCRVEEIVARVLDIVAPKAQQSGVHVEFMAADALPDLYCDPEKIGRVLVNLVVNALKFSPRHSTVRVWALYDGDDGLVRIGVTDHGPGIARDTRDTIFERFKQSTPGDTSRGFGLGLHIARELVGLNFGSMALHSHVGLGSIFSFSVPAWRPAFLLQHYLRHLADVRRDATHVSLLLVETGDTSAAPARPPMETAVGTVRGAALQSQGDALGNFLEERLRRTDLLVRTGPSSWVLVVATAQEHGLRDLVSRLQAEHAKINQVRRHQPLLPLRFENHGTWSCQASEELGIAFAAALGKGGRLPPHHLASSAPAAVSGNMDTCT